MNALHLTIQLPTKDIILLIFFEKFPVMKLREALHHLTKARQRYDAPQSDRAGNTFLLQIFSTPDASQKKK